jgi:hypothetical protein
MLFCSSLHYARALFVLLGCSIRDWQPLKSTPTTTSGSALGRNGSAGGKFAADNRQAVFEAEPVRYSLSRERRFQHELPHHMMGQHPPSTPVAPTRAFCCAEECPRLCVLFLFPRKSSRCSTAHGKAQPARLPDTARYPARW